MFNEELKSKQNQLSSKNFESSHKISSKPDPIAQDYKSDKQGSTLEFKDEKVPEDEEEDDFNFDSDSKSSS